MVGGGSLKNSLKKISIFTLINNVFILLITFIMLYPFANVFAIAFSDYAAYLENPMRIIPKNFNFDAFVFVFKHPLIINSYYNSIITTLTGTIIGILLTIFTAYPLSSDKLKFKPLFMIYIIITIFFNGGLIPNFYLIKNLGLLDNLWALILPNCLVAFNIILLKNFIEGLPVSLKEAAEVEGAGDLRILFKIIVPLSMPIIATLCLFLSVGYWNSFFNAVLYIRTPANWTIQLLLREIISTSNDKILASGGNMAEMGIDSFPIQGLKYATLIVVIMPILCVYPFLQKHFVKGVRLGGVKE